MLLFLTSLWVRNLTGLLDCGMMRDQVKSSSRGWKVLSDVPAPARPPVECSHMCDFSLHHVEQNTPTPAEPSQLSESWEIINCRFKPQSFEMICYAATDNWGRSKPLQCSGIVFECPQCCADVSCLQSCRGLMGTQLHVGFMKGGKDGTASAAVLGRWVICTWNGDCSSTQTFPGFSTHF